MCLPSNQVELRRGLIKRITSRGHLNTVFTCILGGISSVIIHFSHKDEPLPASVTNHCSINSHLLKDVLICIF